MSDQARVTVDKAALDKFIEEAGAAWGQRDQEFCAGEDEFNDSEEEFARLVAALRIEGMVEPQ